MLRFYATSGTLVPNPRLDRVNLPPLRVVAVAEGNQLTWTSSRNPSAWRVFRLDASLDGPQVLVAILPTAARTWTDRRDAAINPYRQGHAHTYLVFAVA